MIPPTMLDSAWVGDYLPRVLPAPWRVIEERADDRSYRHELGLAVIVSGDREQDGKRWLHVSCSRATRLPSWEDIRVVKNLFIGPERLALQVLPPESRYINIHPHVLHLWHCVDGDPIPDFARGGTSI